MKTAICYYSRHHGNTLKVLEAMAEAAEIDLIDVTSRMAAHLPQYDRIGFASGIYYSKFHDTVVHYAAQYLPEGKETFFVCTHGSTTCPEKYYAAITEAVKTKNCPILGTFSCRGYDTFGPFKLIGGMAWPRATRMRMTCKGPVPLSRPCKSQKHRQFAPLSRGARCRPFLFCTAYTAYWLVYSR